MKKISKQQLNWLLDEVDFLEDGTEFHGEDYYITMDGDIRCFVKETYDEVYLSPAQQDIIFERQQRERYEYENGYHRDSYENLGLTLKDFL